MTVADLLAAIADVPGDAIVTCSPGGGVLSCVTPTVNGFVILDATPDTHGIWVETVSIRGSGAKHTTPDGAE